MATCYHCGHEIPVGAPIVRSSECPSCRRDLRVCRNCRHFSPGSHWDCRETVSDQVVDKERANFCDWFRMGEAGGSGPSGAEKAKKARDGLAALFGD
jgi:hypothetical protein